MDGILNVLKPPGMTSFDVIALLRGMLGTRKIGHAGTLDPLATGVLPVCAGRATRAIEFMMEKDKFYRAELTLGITTDTQDSTGKKISSAEPACTDEDIRASVSSFIGKYMQLPPMYSALRIDGRRLYDLAREGAEVERERREVEIYSAEVIDIDRSNGLHVLIDVHCSKGTYIRTLCADIGESLGCGGHMSFLLRKRAGPFEIASSVTLEELERRKRESSLESVLLDPDIVFKQFDSYRLSEAEEKKFRNGVEIEVGHRDRDLVPAEMGQGPCPCVPLRVYGAAGNFTALGTIHKTDGTWRLKVKKFFI
ncbi:MAG TPA: tRNA pseudouridine(55) synthase TruB [Clostridia bacterium]|nr:tRNA pseudouridine(55) synthase TruB [Clostridia bacterium]